ncbi:MAG: hypothetical protein M1816_004498 [Peltula sp. TS41687]|nr:MAG: hypothetical protein M1816_004498 [Peltula sp. TS41687]
MANAAAFNVVGVLMGVVGMIGLGKDLFAAKEGATTNVRVHVGLAKDSSNTGGSLPDIALFDAFGNVVGRKESSDNGHVKNGNYVDIRVEHNDKNDNRQSEYLSISAGNTDAICVAGITVTWPDAGKQAWVGDIGRMCEVDWFYSETIIGEGNNKPACIWLDSDGTNGLHYAGMAMHITDFAFASGRTEQYQNNRDTMCKSAPRFKMYPKLGFWDNIPFFDPPLKYVAETLADEDTAKVLVPGKINDPGPGSERPRKKTCHDYRGLSICTRDEENQFEEPAERKVAENVHFMAGQLIVSESKGHSAKELCESKTSKGPDFVSTTEKLYCDMKEKKVYPLCVKATDRACFDETIQKLRPAAGPRRRDGAWAVPEKSYHTVRYWK